MTEPTKKSRPFLRRAAFLLVLVGAGLGVNQALIHPDTPLPPEWNPLEPFDVAHAPSPLTDWKIGGLMAQPGACAAVLQERAQITPMPPLETSETCGIALRTALWERHGLQPGAQDILGQGVREIRHYSSYNCRRIRTPSGESNRWSTHATARAVDISGFILDDGERVDLKEHWDETGPKAAFLRHAQETACEVFGLVLGPEYNALHADHFHIQLDWTGCR